MSRKCQSLQGCKRLILVLANALVLSACAVVVSLALLDNVRNPTTDAISVLRLRRRPSVLDVWRLDIEARDGGFCGKAGAATLGTTTTAFTAATAAHQGLNLRSLLWRGSLCCGISEQ